MREVTQGKVRDIYDVGNNQWLIVATDRISAFDMVLPLKIPDKGVILNRMSAYWFGFTHDIMPNHMISIRNEDMPTYFQRPEFAGRCMLVKKLKMLPIECIVRGYLTGSGWESYQKTGSVCGISLPDGLQNSGKLPSPIYTPTTKATSGHDEHISYEDTVHLVGEDIASQLRDKSIEIYTKCADYALSRGIIIADTKFEFGVDENGTLVLADELLTPDSSRFWSADDYTPGVSQKSFDKQLVRDWLSQSGWDKQSPPPMLPQEVSSATHERYMQAYNMLTKKGYYEDLYSDF